MRIVEKRSFTIAMLAIVGLLMLLSSSGSTTAQDKPKRKTFQATALGRGTTTFGKMISVNIAIDEYSTPEDQQILVEAFNAAGMEGVTNALSKMKSKGRLSVTGTLGYEVNYIRSFPNQDGSRKIRLVTNRPITIGERWSDRRSTDYNLSALELNVSPAKGKSTGTLLPACQFKIDKEQQLTIENFQEPWQLTNIQDR